MRLILCLALALISATAAPTPVSLVEDVKKLAVAEDNDQRFDALTALLREHNLPFTVEPFTIDKPIGREPRTSGKNVVVTIGETGDPVVVGAHYDAVRLPDGSLSRGAVDNGASSVMLVHFAEALRAERLPLRIRIVWFDMEELGLVGSAKYVQAHSADRIRAMVNFDIDASGDTILFGAPAGGEDAALQRSLMEVCAASVLDCIRFAQLPASDDRSFGRARIPSISIALLPAIEAHQLWLLLKSGANSGLPRDFVPPILRTIHTANDVIEKVDGESVERQRQFALALVRRLAGSKP